MADLIFISKNMEFIQFTFLCLPFIPALSITHTTKLSSIYNNATEIWYWSGPDISFTSLILFGPSCLAGQLLTSRNTLSSLLWTSHRHQLSDAVVQETRRVARTRVFYFNSDLTKFLLVLQSWIAQFMPINRRLVHLNPILLVQQSILFSRSCHCFYLSLSGGTPMRFSYLLLAFSRFLTSRPQVRNIYFSFF